MNKNDLKGCPFCGEIPNYYKHTSTQSWDDAGNKNFGFKRIKPYGESGASLDIPVVMTLPAETVTCNNLKCSVRPRVTRVNSDDCIEIWNIRY